MLKETPICQIEQYANYDIKSSTSNHSNKTKWTDDEEGDGEQESGVEQELEVGRGFRVHHDLEEEAQDITELAAKEAEEGKEKEQYRDEFDSLLDAAVERLDRRDRHIR